MSQPSVREDLHSFLRHSLPGYILIVISLVPMLILPLPLLAWFKGFELLSIFATILAGPVAGAVIYWIYYLLWGWSTVTESDYYRRIADEIGDRVPRGQLEAFTSAFEDRILFDKDNKEYAERLFFLWSTVHSIGASILALFFGLAFWIPPASLMWYYGRITVWHIVSFFVFAATVMTVMILLCRYRRKEARIARASELVFVDYHWEDLICEIDDYFRRREAQAGDAIPPP